MSSADPADPADLESAGLSAGEAHAAARFWLGKGAPTRKAEALAAVAAAMRDKALAAALISGMRGRERTVLAVVERYGGTIDGWLLRMELMGRGVIFEVDRARSSDARKSDPVRPLRERLVLVSAEGFGGSFSSWSDPYHYPRLTLARAARGIVPAAGPPPWKPPAALPVPESIERRTTAEWMLELEQVASALASFGRLRLNRSGALPAALRSRLAKALPVLVSGGGPTAVPDAIELAYAMLVELGVVVIADDGTGTVAIERLHRHLSEPPLVHAQAWLASWLSTPLWMDGVGAINGTNMDDDEVGKARRLVAWALARAAAQGASWLALEPFLDELHSLSDSVKFYAFYGAWRLELAGDGDKHALPAGPVRRRAFWLDGVGGWCANAILVTLHHFGLVERAYAGTGWAGWAFRLTELGRRAFAAPDASDAADVSELTAPARCLTVQPNFDVLLYTDAATSGSVIGTLGRLGEATPGGGVVRTYRITRASLCRALDGGVSLDDALGMLEGESRFPVPANVIQSMTDWARKRDTLVLRRGARVPLPTSALAVAEDGRVSARPGVRLDLVTRARLARLGSSSGAHTFTITRRSISQARDLGLSSAHALAWLGGEESVPPILRVALERWFAPPSRTGAAAPGSLSLGSLLVLRVVDPKVAHALRTSERIAPLLAGEIAPGWLVVRPTERKRLDALLDEIGLDVASTPVIAPALMTSPLVHHGTDALIKEIDVFLALSKRKGRGRPKRGASFR